MAVRATAAVCNTLLLLVESDMLLLSTQMHSLIDDTTPYLIPNKYIETTHKSTRTHRY